MSAFTIDTSPLVDKAVRQLAATSTFLREIPVLDSNKTNFLNQRIRTALREIRKTIDAQREYDARQLDETTKFSTKPRPDAEAVAKEHADFIVKEVRTLLNKKDVEVYEYRVVNPINAELNKENLQLKEQLKQKTIELQAAQLEIARLNAELAKLTADKEALEKALVTEKLKYSRLELAKLKVDGRLKMLRAKLLAEKAISTGFTTQVGTLQGEVITLQQQLTQKESELRALGTSSQSEKATLEAQISILRQQLTQKDSVLLALQASSKAEKERLEKELSELQQLYDSLQRTEKELRNNNIPLLEANRKAIEANKQLKQLHEAALLLKTQEISALKSKLEELQNALSMARNDAIKKRAERAEDAAIIYEKEKTNLQTEIETLREQLKQTNVDYQRKLLTSQSQLAVQPAAPTSLPSDLQTIRDLQNKIQELEAKLQVEVGKTAAALQQGQGYHSRISELTEEIESSKTQLTTALNTASEQTLKLSNVSDEPKSMNEELERLKREHATQIATLDAKIRELESQLDKPISAPAIQDTKDLDILIATLASLQSTPISSLMLQQTSDTLSVRSFQDSKTEEIRKYLIGLLGEYESTIRDLTNRQKEAQVDSSPLQSSPLQSIPEVSSADLNHIAALEAQIKQLRESEQSTQEQLAVALQENEELKNQINTLHATNAELQEQWDTTFVALYELFKKLAEVLGIQETDYGDHKSAFVLAIIQGLKNSIETVKKAQVYAALEQLSKTATETIGQAKRHIRDIYEEAVEDFVGRMEEATRNIKTHIEDFQEQSQTYKVHMSSELSEQVSNIIKILSDTQYQIQQLLNTYNKTNIEQAIGSYNEIIKSLEDRIFGARQDNPLATLMNDLRRKSEDLTKKSEALESERNKAMSTVNGLTNQLITFLESFASDLGDTFSAIQIDLQKGLTPAEKPDSPDTIIDIYQDLDARWSRLTGALPIVLNKAIEKISAGLRNIESSQAFLKQVTDKFNSLDPSITRWDELSTDVENTQFVTQITDRLQQLPIKEQELAKLQSKLQQYSKLEKQLQTAHDNITLLEKMNASAVTSNNRLINDNTQLEQQLKLTQQGVPLQLSSGPGMSQPMINEANLSGYVPHAVSGGYDSTTYTPIIAAATGSLLWWGFGGLLVFLILIVIYLLGREIYRTQFKSETNRKNIK